MEFNIKTDQGFPAAPWFYKLYDVSAMCYSCFEDEKSSTVYCNKFNVWQTDSQYIVAIIITKVTVSTTVIDLETAVPS